MGEHNDKPCSDPDALRHFMKCLLTDLRALEQLIADGALETGVRRIGAEQEVVLIDHALRPAPINLEVLDRLNDPQCTTELGRFNLEFNLDPQLFAGDCLSRLERTIDDKLAGLREVLAESKAHVLLTGCLPTLRKSDMELGNMTPLPRYYALNEALMRLRGGEFELRFIGTDELILKHDSVMLESCNTSCQFHFQVGPEEFAKLYNIAQLVTAPVLAVAVNSPHLFGQRLWKETRIALFQQAIDPRSTGRIMQERTARVSFGNSWVKDSVLEVFREDIARFRVVMAMDIDEDPYEALAAGRAPKLQALNLHNSTVYRWNRPCYGVLNGKPNLRIENRVLSAGPTPVDEVANAAFWFGLMSAIVEQHGDVTGLMDFDVAKTNFLTAARLGMSAQFTWLDGKRHLAQDLIRDELVPLARAGLKTSGILQADIDRYLGVIEARSTSGVTGARWLLDSLAGMKERGTKAERLSALTAATLARQTEGKPVHTWAPARLEEAGGWKKNYLRVEQYMSCDLFTVHPDEVIDLVASLMDWRNIRHVPVEDENHRLVGLVSYRSLVRVLARDIPHDKDHPLAVEAIMLKDPITVTPETSTIDAIALMRREKVACLPVVKDDRLVGIITERDYVHIAGQLLEDQLREASD